MTKKPTDTVLTPRGRRAQPISYGYAVTDERNTIILWTCRVSPNEAVQAYDLVLGKGAFDQAKENRKYRVQRVRVTQVPESAIDTPIKYGQLSSSLRR